MTSLKEPSERSYISDRATVGEENELIMVNRCVAGGCSNTARPGVSLYKFPKDPALRRQWEKQVQRTRSKWKATESSFLCSEHFTPDCFDERAKLAAEYGIVRKRPLLPSAIPTVFPRTTSSSSAAGPSAGESSRKRQASSISTTSTKRTRMAAEKRHRMRVRIDFSKYYTEVLFSLVVIDCTGGP